MALLVQLSAVPLDVELWVVARLNTPICQPDPVQYSLSPPRFKVKVVLLAEGVNAVSVFSRA